MDEKLFIDLAIQEIELKRFGTTQQILEVHDVVRENGLPKLERIAFSEINDQGPIIAYFPIANEEFYIAIYLNSVSPHEVTGSDTVSGVRVYFSVTSDTYSFSEMQSFTSLAATGGWSKGDLRGKGKKHSYTFSRLSIEPYPEVDFLEKKIEKLLNFLEVDKEGIFKLSQVATAYISVVMYIHNSYQTGGIHLEQTIIKRVSNLNLSIDFDIYIVGNPFIS